MQKYTKNAQLPEEMHKKCTPCRSAQQNWTSCRKNAQKNTPTEMHKNTPCRNAQVHKNAHPVKEVSKKIAHPAEKMQEKVHTLQKCTTKLHKQAHPA